MRVAVTGAGGLIGGHVARALQDAGHQVRALVRPTTDVQELVAASVPFACADIRSPVEMRSALDGCEVLVHCAAIFAYSGVSDTELHQTNVDGTHCVLRAAADVGMRRVVVTSSSVTCGSSEEPISLDEHHVPGSEYLPAYFITKIEQERLALALGHQLGLEIVIACPTIVLGGPDRRLVPSNRLLVRYLMDPLRTTYPGGCNIVSVRDIAAGHILLAERGEAGQRYLLGGENWGWRTIHQTVSELSGISGPGPTATYISAYVGASLLQMVAQMTGRSALSTRAEARVMGRYYWYNHNKAAALGYSPRPARRALAEALSWLATSSHLPRFIRSSLTLLPEVYEARELTPRPLQSE